ncbi:MAG: DUF4270 family protein [Flavisolibacter sp.]
MKRNSLAFSLLIVLLSVLIGFISCKKINNPTELGSNLLPGVDNVHTFEVALNTETNNAPFYDTTKFTFNDVAALGSIDDPEFGQTNASIFFNISSATYGIFPFKVDRANVNDPNFLNIDSVILSLSYNGSYGDTNASQTLHVFEIANDNSFLDSTIYTFTHDPFPTTGTELGSVSFIPANLKDSVTEIIKSGDTVRSANVIRIKFNNNSLGQRFANYDTIAGSSNGGFASDSIFRTLFRGFAIKADNAAGSGNLSYINLSDTKNTRLTIYFRSVRNGVTDTSALDFHHITNGQANIIQRTPGGNYASYLANGNSPDDKIYLQSSPGSYASIRIPALDTFKNKLIHRAEIIAVKVPSVLDNLFTPPSRLIIDRINALHDTAFILQNDLVAGASGSVDFTSFGGTLGADNNYRFNVSRYLQSLITKHLPNDTLRMYAPLRTILFDSNLNQFISVPVLSQIANGRVVLGGGSYPDPAIKLRLRIIYSDL